MRIGLVVLQAFGDHQKGDRVDEADKVKEILESENQTHVVKVDLDAPSLQPSEPKE